MRPLLATSRPSGAVTVTSYTGQDESGRSNEVTTGYAQIAPLMDTDRDGLSDAIEDRNLNRALDGGALGHPGNDRGQPRAERLAARPVEHALDDDLVGGRRLDRRSAGRWPAHPLRSCAAPQPRAVIEVVDFGNPDRIVGYGEAGRVRLTTLTREFFVPGFLERDEGEREPACEKFPWDGISGVRPFRGRAEPQWTADLRALARTARPPCVIFGTPRPIEAMFYTPCTAYPFPAGPGGSSRVRSTALAASATASGSSTGIPRRSRARVRAR